MGACAVSTFLSVPTRGPSGKIDGDDGRFNPKLLKHLHERVTVRKLLARKCQPLLVRRDLLHLKNLAQARGGEETRRAGKRLGWDLFATDLALHVFGLVGQHDSQREVLGPKGLDEDLHARLCQEVAPAKRRVAIDMGESCDEFPDQRRGTEPPDRRRSVCLRAAYCLPAEREWFLELLGRDLEGTLVQGNDPLLVRRKASMSARPTNRA